jgi:hypothetical protein
MPYKQGQEQSSMIGHSKYQKCNMYVSKYFEKMNSLDDKMATVGHPLEDKELVEYILIGLDDVCKYFKNEFFGQ